jgi:1-acyl-sn-glycerol-3-phosphate acyltransferase
MPVSQERDVRSWRWDYRLAYALTRQFAVGYQGLHQHTPCPIPRQGPALVVANHTSGLDPTLVQASCRRPIVWLMTREFYDLPHLHWFFKWSGMIPIDVAGHDSKAWRESIRALKRGQVVGVFPEGRIEREGKVMPFQTGVSLLAIRGGAPIFPVYLDGLQRNVPMLETYLSAQYPSVAWGKPIFTQGRSTARNGLEALTRELQASVESLGARYSSPRRRGKSMLE